MSKARSLLEQLPLSSNRVVNYLDAAGRKFKLGPYVDELYLKDDRSTIVNIYGPSENRLIKGKYIYLFMNFKSSSRAKGGYLTHFAVSDKQLGKRDIKSVGTGYTVGGVKAKPIPPDFKKFQEIMSLIIGAGQNFDSDKSNATEVAASPVAPGQIYDINKRFEFMAYLVRMVSMKITPGMIITGTGGLGKTYTVMNTLHNLGLKEDEDYLHLHGTKLTPVTFYTTLHDNANKLIIFDDSDAILDSEVAVNMLKSALDTSGQRTVSYMSPAIESQGYPTKFLFEGQIIFISNRPIATFNQALKSRSYIADVSMTREEVLDRMQAIIDSGKLDDGNVALQTDALNLIREFGDKYPGKPEDLNMRTLLKVYRIIAADPEGGRDIATYLLSVG